MSKDDNIHIKLELWKDKTSSELAISAIFNQNAPNFSKDENGYVWWPTFEEKEFLNEAFSLLSGDKTSKTSVKSSVVNKTALDEPTYTLNDKKEILQSDVKKEDVAVFEVTDEEKNKEIDHEDKEEILVSADSDAIDKALKKGKDKREMVEVDEQTIIDKVLSQKKKNKWTKP